MLVDDNTYYHSNKRCSIASHMMMMMMMMSMRKKKEKKNKEGDVRSHHRLAAHWCIAVVGRRGGIEREHGETMKEPEQRKGKHKQQRQQATRGGEK
mmetsp:Transcript_41544/g.66799  ORF Transcript_41544/g.66799 Transcript_41544/m.66799 type:complete len:96 (+) Transcript_41544:154-441(+)